MVPAESIFIITVEYDSYIGWLCQRERLILPCMLLKFILANWYQAGSTKIIVFGSSYSGFA